MPVTAKLSRKFYETFGDEMTNELVNWFNQVDTQYRSELRELNEANFARFDAKLEQRIGEVKTEMHEGFARADAKLEQRIAEVRTQMHEGFARADAKLEQRIAEVRAEMQAGFARFDGRLEAGFASFDAKLDQLRAELVKWMFLFWAGTMLTLVALLRL
jgi:DNA anti-recombination protein RmuC